MGYDVVESVLDAESGDSRVGLMSLSSLTARRSPNTVNQVCKVYQMACKLVGVPCTSAIFTGGIGKMGGYRGEASLQ